MGLVDCRSREVIGLPLCPFSHPSHLPLPILPLFPLLGDSYGLIAQVSQSRSRERMKNEFTTSCLLCEYVLGCLPILHEIIIIKNDFNVCNNISSKNTYTRTRSSVEGSFVYADEL